MKLRLPRFSLRTLVVFLLLATSAFGLAYHFAPWYCERTLDGHAALVMHTVFSNDGMRLLTSDGEAATRTWDVETGVSLGVMKRSPREVIPSFRGPTAGPAPSRSREIWRALQGASSTPYFTYSATTSPGCGAVSPDETRVVTGDKTGALIMWDARTGRRLCTVGSHERGTLVIAADFSPSGRRLATGGVDRTARIWRRRRPEWWWGVFYLWEFWLTAAFAALFVWSIVRDRRSLHVEVQPTP